MYETKKYDKLKERRKLGLNKMRKMLKNGAIALRQKLNEVKKKKKKKTSIKITNIQLININSHSIQPGQTSA